VVADVAPGGPAAGAAGATLRAPAAWRVERVGGEVRETRLDPGPIRGA
jgi:hypothetical protein